jgi:hypothetical protein
MYTFKALKLLLSFILPIIFSELDFALIKETLLIGFSLRDLSLPDSFEEVDNLDEDDEETLDALKLRLLAVDDELFLINMLVASDVKLLKPFRMPANTPGFLLFLATNGSLVSDVLIIFAADLVCCVCHFCLCPNDKCIFFCFILAVLYSLIIFLIKQTD